MRKELVLKCIFLFQFFHFSHTSVYKNTKKEIELLNDDDNNESFFDELEPQEVLEVPIEYEDDDKPSEYHF